MNVNRIDKINKSPLTSCYYAFNHKIFNYLIKNGTNINKRNGLREYPLTSACKSIHGDYALLP